MTKSKVDMTHGARLEVRVTTRFEDHPTMKLPNGKPVQVGVASELTEAHRCGYCHFPVVGDRAALTQHVNEVCPLARAKGATE